MPTFVSDEVVTATKMNLIPKGTLGYAQRTTQQTGITSEVDLATLTVTVDVASSRRIRVTGQGIFLATGQQAVLRIKESTTTLQSGIVATSSVGASCHIEVFLTPSAGSHTYKLTGASLGTAVVLDAAATYPAYIHAEDLGDAV